MMRKSGDRSCSIHHNTSEGEVKMKNHLSRHRFFLLCVLSLFVVPSYPATIRGTVTDPLGAVVVNAKVQLLSGNQVIASAVTSSDGKYQLETSQSGRFHVRAAAPSFAPTDGEE